MKEKVIKKLIVHNGSTKNSDTNIFVFSNIDEYENTTNSFNEDYLDFLNNISKNFLKKCEVAHVLSKIYFYIYLPTHLLMVCYTFYTKTAVTN